MLVTLQSALDELGAVAAAVDDDPVSPEAWADLRAAFLSAQGHFRAAGGKGTLTDDPLLLQKPKLAAITTLVDWAMREPGRPAPVDVPRLADLMRLDRARGLCRELLGAA